MGKSEVIESLNKSSIRNPMTLFGSIDKHYDKVCRLNKINSLHLYRWVEEDNGLVVYPFIRIIQIK